MKSKNEVIEVSSEIDAGRSIADKLPFNIVGVIKHISHRSLAILVFLVLWEVLSAIGLINPVLIPAPSAIAVKMVSLTLSGELITDTFTSLYRVLAGFFLALAVALPLGFLLGGFFKHFETAVNPLLNVLGQANPFTIFPVFILLLGIGELSKVAIIYWVVQWPVLFNTVTGIKNVDPVLIKVARTVGLSKVQMFWKVLLPASLPTVFTGVRMAAVFALFMLIGAEMIGSHSGLGYMIHNAQSTFQYPKMFVGIVVVALLGIAFNYILLHIEKRTTKWKEDIAF